ncbi:MAG: C_GCAxxG_C_C family protein [Synergistaceae bacterium]|nr:C_GCAxxG_C_C family protein [Synergistaceae bacterium]
MEYEKEAVLKRAAEEACRNESRYHLCSQGTLAALMRSFGIHDPDLLRASTAFAGGGVRRGHMCGALSGALLFIGLLAGRDDLEMKEQAVRGLGYCDKLYRVFEERFGTVLCRQIQKNLYGKEYDLTRQEERDEMHTLMETMEFACPQVCGEAARMAALVAFEILEAGHPVANSLIRLTH